MLHSINVSQSPRGQSKAVVEFVVAGLHSGSGVVEKEKWDGEFTEAAVDALADSISEPKLDLPLATNGDATVLAFPRCCL